jgi:serralysin
MSINNSYWGVQGWVLSATTAATYGACIKAYPTGSTTIHHIIMANNVANGCQDNGFTSSNNGSTSSVDYLAIIGNVVYNAAQSSTECYSGISINQPMQSDSAPGTHIFVAGNFSYANFDSPAASCGGHPTDGEGIIFDTFDNQLGGSSTPYAAQALAENNMLIGNGGRGLQVVDNNLATHATVYIRNNTIWGNNRDTNQSATECGELTIQNDSTTIATNNLIATSSATGCGAYPISAISEISSDATNQIDSNFAYAVNGQNAEVYGGGFTYGANTLGVNPNFTNPVVPGAPSCGSASSVPNCMASVVANFTPKTASAVGYGYQIPSSTPVADPLFPQWLCSVNLPAGLVTLGCAN